MKYFSISIKKMLLFLLFCFFGALHGVAEQGYGFIERVFNGSSYPANIRFDRVFHDAFPYGTTVRIQSLADEKEPMYYCVDRVQDPSDKKKFNYVFTLKKVEQENLDTDLSIQFKIRRYVDFNLVDWLGFESLNSLKFMMGEDPDTKRVGFYTDGFQDDKSTQNQFKLRGEDINDCYIEGRSGGCLHKKVAEEEFPIGEEKKETIYPKEVWGCFNEWVPETYRQERAPTMGSFSRKWNGWISIEENQKLAQVQFSASWIGYIGHLNANGFDTSWLGNFAAIPWPSFKGVNGGYTDLEKRLNNDIAAHVNNLNNNRPSRNVLASNWSIKRSIVRNRVDNSWVDVDTSLVPDDTNSQGRNGIAQLSVRSENDIWGVTGGGRVWRYDGKTWTDQLIQEKMDFVSVSADGKKIWLIGNKRVWERYKDGSVQPLPEKMGDGDDYPVQIAIGNDLSIWGITAQGLVYRYGGEGKGWVKQENFRDGPARSITASDDLSVWCTNEKGQVWRANTTVNPATWSMVPGANLIQVAVRSNGDVWGVAKDNGVWHFNGKVWKQVPGLKLSYISVSTNVTTKITPAPTEKRQITSISTSASDGSVYTGKDARVKIEIIKLGKGGGILPNSAADLQPIPVTRNPVVEGFAKTQLQGFSAESVLRLVPLISKGAAWFDSSLVMPGRTSISLVAEAGEDGSVQIVFGKSISSDFVWKIIIDTQKSQIIRRSWLGKDPTDEIVFEVTAPQNPIAVLKPGLPTAIWVSVDNGLILVGLGNIGENIIMGWRDPNPPGDVIFMGFGSDEKPVKYTEILLNLPLVPEVSDVDVYKSSDEVFSTSPSAGNINWIQYPFRTADSCGVEFDLKGSDSAVIAFRKPNSNNHYAVVFGAENNTGIAIKKWVDSKKSYLTRSFVKNDKYPEIKLDPNTSKKFWVSYKFGQIILGTGEFGQNAFTTVSDAAAYTDVSEIGFGAFGTASCEFSNLKIREAAELSITKKMEYTQGKSVFGKASGNVTIIQPWMYQFKQNGQFVEYSDLVSQIFNRRIGQTPQQGTLYYFQAKIDELGHCSLEWTQAPDPIALKSLQEEARTMLSKAELEVGRAGIETKAGEIERALGVDKAGVDKAKYAAAVATQDALNKAAGAVLGVDASSPITSGIAQAANLALVTAGALKAGLSEGFIIDAAKTELAGAEADALAKRRAVEAERQSLQLKFLASQAQGKADFGFRDVNGDQKYLDAPAFSALGAAEQGPEVLACKSRISSQMQGLSPTVSSRDDFVNLVAKLQEIVFNVMFYNVFEAQDKPKFFKSVALVMDKLDKDKTLFPDASPERVEAGKMLFELLFSAYNNAYIVNQNDNTEKKQKVVWYAYINRIAQDIIKTSNAITLPACWGEYVWLPRSTYQIGEDGNCVITFKARASSDVVFCLSPIDGTPLRNTNKSIYEFAIGGYDDTKSMIRTQNLKRTALLVNKEDVLDNVNFIDYWISKDGNILRAGIGKPGEGEFMKWTDPYPQKVKYIGISSWDISVELKDIKLFASMDEAKSSSGVVAKISKALVEEEDEFVSAAEDGLSTKAPTTKKASAVKAGTKVIEEEPAAEKPEEVAAELVAAEAAPAEVETPVADVVATAEQATEKVETPEEKTEEKEVQPTPEPEVAAPAEAVEVSVEVVQPEAVTTTEDIATESE